MLQSHHHAGFTLLELLLYVSIAGIILGGVSVFLASLVQARIKNQTIAEVDQQGEQVLRLMTQTVRNADTINSPAQGGVGASLSVNTYTGALNPTVFDISGGFMRITEGAAAPIQLTNARVTVSNMSIQNLTRTGTPGSVRFMFTVSGVNTGGRQEYSYQKTFLGSASLRQP